MPLSVRYIVSFFSVLNEEWYHSFADFTMHRHAPDSLPPFLILSFYHYYYYTNTNTNTIILLMLLLLLDLFMGNPQNPRQYVPGAQEYGLVNGPSRRQIRSRSQERGSNKSSRKSAKRKSSKLKEMLRVVSTHLLSYFLCVLNVPLDETM